MQTKLVSVTVGSRIVFINPAAIESIEELARGAQVKIRMISGDVHTADSCEGLKGFAAYLLSEHPILIADGSR